MPANDYHFITHWRVESTVAEVHQLLGDAEGLARWWPSVYLEVKTLSSGDAKGVGKIIELFTKGWLPYTLRWSFRVAAIEDDGFTIEAFGDFVGRGVWTFVQNGTAVDITYDWRIRAEKPMLRLMSPLLKPLFARNHEWAMRMGEESLRLELLRRHATETERGRIAEPPPPTPSSFFPWLGSVLRGTQTSKLQLARQ